MLGLVAIAAAVVVPMMGTPLGPVDDHDIPRFLASGVWFPPEIVSRFRPLYWLVRDLEAVAWGMNAAGWYFDRFLLLMATLAAGYLLARRFVAPPLALAAALLVIAGPQAEAWFRLGPQEAIATPLLLGGLALCVRGHAFGLVLLVLAALTKESFVPFAFAGISAGWWFVPKRAVVAAGVVVACVAVVAMPIALRSLASAAPGQGRYLLPFVLIPIAAGVLLLRTRPAAGYAGIALALVLIVPQISIEDTWRNRAMVWQTELAQVREAIDQHPGAALVYAPVSTTEYEHTLALRAYIGPISVAPTWRTGAWAPAIDAIVVAAWQPQPIPNPCIEITADGERRTDCEWTVTVRLI